MTPGWCGDLCHRHALEGFGHVGDPDRQAQATAGFAAAQVARRVVADPCRGHHGGLEAHEPCIHRVVGGAGFAVEVGAFERGLRPGGGARACDFLQQVAHQEGVSGVDGAMRFRRRAGRALIQRAAPLLDHLGDQRGRHAVPAIGKHRIAAGHLHGGSRNRRPVPWSGRADACRHQIRNG